MHSLPHVNSVKITQPALSRYIERDRLYTQLDEHRNKPVIWIVGPGGSGKTTLISSYIEHHKLSAIWFQADEGDGDAATFFHYLAQAAQQSNPRKKQTFPALTADYQFGLPTFSRRFFEQVFSCITQSAILVIDNYQDIPHDSNVHALIQAGVEAVPEHFTVIFLSRHASPEQYSRLQASQKMGRIDWKDLSLQPCEAQEIVAQRVKPGQQLSADVYSRIHGWVAGLVLFLECAQQEEQNLAIFDDFSPESIFDYFASEILRRTDIETRDILLKSSLLPNMNARLVTQLTDNTKSNNILVRLARQSYFVTRHPGQEVSYQYHPLFREFLLNKAAEEYGRDEFDRLRGHAGRLLEESGQIESAIEAYVSAGDYQDLVRAVYACGETMINTGRHKTLLRWVVAVPEALRLKHPLFVLWQSVCEFIHDADAAQKLAEKAFHLFRDVGNVTGIYRSIVVSVYSVLTTWGVVGEKLDMWLELFDEIKAQYIDFPDADLEADVATALTCAFSWRQPDHPDAPYWRQRAEMLLPHISSEASKIADMTILAYMELFSGDLGSAALKLNMVQPVLKHPDLPPFNRTFMMNALSHLAMLRGDTKLCCELAEQGEIIANDTGVKANQFHSLGYAFGSLMQTGDMSKARLYYDRLSEQHMKSPMSAQAFFHWLASCFEFFNGKYDSAKQHGELAVARADASGAIMFMAYSRICLAEALYELNELERARSCLDEALVLSSRGHKFAYHWAKLVDAFYAFKTEDETSAKKKLRDAFAYGRQQGYASYYYWRQEALTDLCIKALENRIEVDYTRQVIQQRNIIPVIPPQHLHDWPWRVRIYTFGEFRLFVNGEQICLGRKVPKKPLNLLKAIVSLGSSDVHESRLFDALWPDEDADSAAVSLKVALHRLRKLLGNEAITLQDGKYGIDPRHCWIDVWAFDRLLNQAQIEISKRNIAHANRDIEAALDLHNGEFLASDMDQPWTLVMRERFRTRVINRIESFGCELEDTASLPRAIDWYTKGLEIDVLAEPFYQGLMRCYMRLNQHADAVRTYQRCQRILTSSLAVEPSPQTKELYQQLCH